MYLVMGVLAALFEAGRSGRGQVVDAAIVDGAASLTTLMHGMLAAGQWRDQRGVNLLDTGVPWYDVYQTSDGQWMAAGPLEPKFFAEFMTPAGPAAQGNRAGRPACLADPAGADRGGVSPPAPARSGRKSSRAPTACVAPVLSLTEAADHPHLAARGTFTEVAGVRQPGPATPLQPDPGSRPKVPGPARRTHL